MGTEETLRRRKDIPDEIVQDLVASAAELQDLAQAKTSKQASSHDIESVAAELDIAPQYVEQAIARWRAEAAAKSPLTGQSKIARRRKKTMRMVGTIAVVSTGLMAGLAVMGVSFFGLSALLAVGALGVVGLGFLVWLIT